MNRVARLFLLLRYFCRRIGLKCQRLGRRTFLSGGFHYDDTLDGNCWMEKVAGCAGRASPLNFGRLDKTDLRAGRLANSYFMLKRARTSHGVRRPLKQENITRALKVLNIVKIHEAPNRARFLHAKVLACLPCLALLPRLLFQSSKEQR